MAKDEKPTNTTNSDNERGERLIGREFLRQRRTAANLVNVASESTAQSSTSQEYATHGSASQGATEQESDFACEESILSGTLLSRSSNESDHLQSFIAVVQTDEEAPEQPRGSEQTANPASENMQSTMSFTPLSRSMSAVRDLLCAGNELDNQSFNYVCITTGARNDGRNQEQETSRTRGALTGGTRTELGFLNVQGLNNMHMQTGHGSGQQAPPAAGNSRGRSCQHELSVQERRAMTRLQILKDRKKDTDWFLNVLMVTVFLLSIAAIVYFGTRRR